MDDDPVDIIKNFENILKKNDKKEPLSLYRDHKSKNVPSFQSQTSCNVQDVISNVCKQIKAIQGADVPYTRKQNRKKLDKYKKSSFLPLNLLPKDDEVPTKLHTTKFETQFVCDTQLLQIIDNADALVENNGITQEFDHTFSQKDIESVDIDVSTNKNVHETDKAVPDSNSSIINKETYVIDQALGSSVDTNVNTMNNREIEKVTIETFENYKMDTASNDDDEFIGLSNKENMQLNDNCTEMINKCIETETNSKSSFRTGGNDRNEEIQLSLVFETKRPKSISPLVFDLTTFENFEKIAVPIVDDNVDIKSAKQLINSQILGKELYIQTNVPPDISQKEEQLSPILKISGERIKVTKTEMNIDLTHNSNKDQILVTVKEDTFLKDEILFSSDEENEYLHKEFQDIPLTCALETSFYEEPDMLDKTMYVGFQTASNRSIQISTESFSKAKSILDDVEKVPKATFTDFVENVSAQHKTGTAIRSQIKMEPKTTGIEFKFDKSDSVTSVEKEIDNLKRLDKRKFEGFITASRKKIKLSDMALARCKRVFQDIDLNEDFNVHKTETKDSSLENLIRVADETCVKALKENEVKSSANNTLETNPQIDDDILQEFAHDMSVVIDEDKVVNIKTIKTGTGIGAKRFFDGIDFSERTLGNYTKEISKEDLIKNSSEKIISLKAKSDSNPDLVGFKSAINNIPLKALEKAKSTLHDIQTCEDDTNFNPFEVRGLTSNDIDIEDFNQPTTSKGISAFKTASNKNIKVSNEALVRSKSILQDIIKNVCENESADKSTRNEQAIGFKNANNEDIEISNDAYLKAKHVFKDIEIKKDIKSNDVNKEQKTTIQQTNNNNLEQDKAFDDDLNEMFNTELLDVEKEHIPEFIGFKTASNKRVNVSEKALAHSRNVFKDLDFDTDFTRNNNDDVKLFLRKSGKETQREKIPSEIKSGNITKTQFDTQNYEKSQNIDGHLNNKKSFIGFQTASSKPINISDKALAKSKEIFKDIDNKGDDMTPILDIEDNVKVAQFGGFRTGNNKNIPVSAKSLAKSKDIFKDIHENQDFDDSSYKGFQTANHKKPIKVSDEALARSKALFRNIDNDDNLNSEVKNQDIVQQVKRFPKTIEKPFTISPESDFDIIAKDTNEKDIPVFKGFQTASKKPVKISSEALAKSKAIFEDIDQQYRITDKENIVTNLESIPKFEGFQTANKKPVYISAEAIAKNKAVFQDIDTEFDKGNNSKYKKTDFQFKGFQIASEKSLLVSEESSAKSEELLKDITRDYGDNTINHNDMPKFAGFQTASKKSISVSEEALAKSKALFKDIGQMDVKDESIKDDVSKFIGFETASKKPVRVSEEALAKSKDLFKDIDSEHVVEKVPDNRKADFSEFIGFKTASKKPVKISEDALVKRKSLFKEIGSDERPVSQILGFQTANNKSVKVSEEALARSKIIFNEIDDCTDNNDVDKETVPFKGFETASNKKVKISEESLRKTRLILKDCKEKIDRGEKQQQFQTNFTFKTGNANEITISEKAIRDSKNLLTDSDKHLIDVSKTDEDMLKDNNLDKLIDTQVLNNFEQTLYTEDFDKVSPKQSKRSGSPILLCPKAKKRKFNTPYRTDPKTPIVLTKITPKHQDIPIFNDDYKKNKRYTLKDLAKVEKTNEKLKPDPYILNFNTDNILDFKFYGLRNDVTEGTITVDDLKEYFVNLVNKKLIPNGWLNNHIQLIMWKLISYEVKFTQTLSRVCSAKNVIDQLKYRYDKELYHVERPILRKIMEKDDVASKTMVLCVAGIFLDGVKVSSVSNISSNVELELTDGWYCVKAVIDRLLTKLVYDGKIVVGMKIMVNGAELLNCDQGIAPWEDTSSVRLKISGNSTRRARWDARLGCHGNAAMLTKLSSVKPEGGKVSKLRLYVTRVYPMLYVEKFEDGSTVTRSERLENIHQIKYESDRQTVMEKLYEEVERELSDQESQDSEGSQIKKRMHYDSVMSESQTKALEEKSNKKRERLLQNIQERVRKKIEEKGFNVRRNVVTLLKIRVAGVDESKHGANITKGFLSIWKPNDMLTEIIKEDSWIEVMNVIPTAVRYSELHLSAGRQSVFNQSKFKENDKIKPYLKTLARKCYPVGDLAQNPSMTTDYNEIDTVGFIFQIDVESTKQPFQNMYISDGGTNIVCINFWGGLRKFGFHNVLDTGQVISCSNLQKRAGNTRKSIPQFRVTEFTIFTKTPKNLVARAMIVEIEKKISGLDKIKYVEDCVKVKNNYSNKCFTENVSPYRFNDLNLTKNKIFIDSPLAKVEENLNLTGLDFESTFRQDPEELSPKSKERKRKVNEKISRLKMIGEPPPLSPMNIINKSKNAFNSFKSPIANTSATSEVNTIKSSPIIQLNRTFTKKVNPIKLNFSNVQENSIDEVDHFAEEFDGSPPLSLE